MMESVFSLEIVLAFSTLFALELVLGVDNIIFISILAAKLPLSQQKRARQTGLLLAVITRVILLLSISWVASLTNPIFTLFSEEISGRDIILILGGLFLIAKSTHEIHQKLEAPEELSDVKSSGKFWNVVGQILVLDIVFSLDSVITAVGMTSYTSVMVAAVICATLVMIFVATPISNFVDRHPTVKILSLSFLLLIGVTLIAEGMDQHISKGYIYFAMCFSLFVEILNLKMRSQRDPVHLKKNW